jgi:hypothetical protein
MIEGKRPPGRPHNSFIGKIKRDAGVESYRTLKEIASDREEWRRNVSNQPRIEQKRKVLPP